MGIHRGSNIIRSGLEFAFDTGYTSVLSNKDSYIYNQGEPTTNYITANLETLGTDGSGQSSVGTRTTVAPNHVKIVDVASNTRQSYLISGLTGGATYTVSIEFKKLDGTPTFRYQLQDYSGSSYVRTIKFTNTAETGLTDIYGWQTAKWTFTLGSDANAVRIWLQDGADYTTYTHSFELRNPQLEAKGHATPYVSGTRSASGSLLDLTRQSTIDLTNVSFDSNAHMTFDGTDDKGEVSNFPAIWNGSVSLEAVASWDDDSRSIIFGNYNCNNNDINFEKLTGGTLRFYWGRGARDVTTTGNPRVTTSGDYHHVVFVRDTSANNFRFYVDGTLVTTVSNAGSNITSTGSTFRIGGDTRNGTTIHNGNIPILRVYSKALTTEEVAQNFSAYRDRFNI
jgi:hypothetical protein